jgi:hypothetical protein
MIEKLMVRAISKGITNTSELKEHNKKFFEVFLVICEEFE